MYVADYVNLNTKMISYINLVFIIVQPRPAIEPLLLKRVLNYRSLTKFTLREIHAEGIETYVVGEPYYQ